MKRITCRIEGTTPLLLQQFTDAAAAKATEGNRVSMIGHHGTPREQAASCIYTNGDKNVPIMPQPNLFRCIMDAGKFFKAGKSKVTTQKSSLIPACLDMEGLYYVIEHREPWDVDTRPVRIPATGGRILRHRPRFNDWAIEFSMNLDSEMLAPKLLREIVDAAGKRIGLGDFRPDCKGPFGKFVVTKWEEAA